jgi:hypothetical protein
MTLFRKFIKLFILVILALSLLSCGGWKTRYSGKHEESNEILIYLDKEGGFFIGHCGVCRKVEESYRFQLKPVKRSYVDDEIKMVRDGYIEPIDKPIGTVSFDENYTTVTINIKIIKNGHFIPFAGNGKYAINAND